MKPVFNDLFTQIVNRCVQKQGVKWGFERKVAECIVSERGRKGRGVRVYSRMWELLKVMRFRNAPE